MLNDKKWPLVLVGLAAACGDDDPAPPDAPDDPPVARAEVLVEGSPLPGSNGMAFAPDRSLYVAGAFANRISVVDPRTGDIRAVLGAAGDVRTPDDVAVAPDGTLYWTSLLTGEVGRRRTDGTIDVAATLPPGVNPIEVAPDGRVFVGLCVFGDALYELDPAGARPPRLIAAGIGGGCAINGMELGPDGRLYGTQPLLGRVVAIDVETGAVTPLATGFSPTAYAVTFAPSGALYAVDGTSVFAIESGARRLVATLPWVADNLVADTDGSLLVSSLGTAAIARVGTDGVVTPVIAGGLYFPQGIAADGEGGLLVTNGAGITRYRDDGALDRPVSFDPFAATTLEVTADRWITAVPAAGVVSVWDPATARPTAIGADFRVPIDARAFGRDVLVAEAGALVVTRVDPSVPSTRSPFTALASPPGGLAVSGGDVFVTAPATGAVLQIAAAGEPLEPARIIATGLAGPSSVVATPDELVVVEASAGRVTLIARADGASRTLDDALLTPAPPGASVFPVVTGLARDARGVVYVTDAQTNRIVRITP